MTEKFRIGSRVEIQRGFPSIWNGQTGRVSGHGAFETRVDLDGTNPEDAAWFAADELKLIEPQFQVGDVVEFVENIVVTGVDEDLVHLKIPGLGVVEKRSVLSSRLKLVSRPEKEIPFGTQVTYEGCIYVFGENMLGAPAWILIKGWKTGGAFQVDMTSVTGRALTKIARESL